MNIKKDIKWLKDNNIEHEVKNGLIIINQELIIESKVKLENVSEVSGSVDVHKNASLNAPQLKEVSGYVDVYENASLDAPQLTKSGSVYVYENATFEAPQLKEVSGSVDVHKNASFDAPQLTKSGSVYVHKNATFEAPTLHTVKQYDADTEFLGHNIVKFDGIGCVVLSDKERDGIVIRSCRKASFDNGELVGDKMYVVSKDGHNAHGGTLKSALSDLMFKTADRNIDKYKGMSHDEIKTPEEWAVMYRIITGACQWGTQNFIEQQGKLKEQYSLSEIVKITDGAYGSQRFKEVINER